MGSGSSKSDPKKTGQQKGPAPDNKSASKSPERVLLGSSEPPKGPWASKGGHQAVKGPEKRSVDGNGLDRDQNKGTNHVINDESTVRPVSRRAKR